MRICLFRELLEHRIGRAESIGNQLCQFAGRLLRIGRKTLPEEIVVPKLAGIVEQRSGPCRANQFDQRVSVKPSLGGEIIGLVDISLTMLPVMVLQGFRRHVRRQGARPKGRSEEHTSELQSLMRISYAVSCLKQKPKQHKQN